MLRSSPLPCPLAFGSHLPAWHPLCDTADEELRVSVDEQLASPRSHCLPDCHNTCLDLCYIVGLPEKSVSYFKCL